MWKISSSDSNIDSAIDSTIVSSGAAMLVAAVVFALYDLYNISIHTTVVVYLTIIVPIVH
jgi:hypothetical protein